MIEGGYTVWARQSIDSDIFFYKPDKWFKIWFYIVNKVNHKKNKLFERGCGLITYSDIHDKTKATKTQTYKCIRFLKQKSMIDAEKTTRGFIIKVLNYDKYQDSKNYKDDKETNERRLTDDREANTINNNDNNEIMKEEEKSVALTSKYPTLESVKESDFEKVAIKNGVPISFVRSKYDDMINWHEKNPQKNYYKNYYAGLRDWVKRDALKIKQGGTNGKFVIAKI